MSAASSSQTPPPTPDLTRLFSERYATVRAQHPGEGRRKWRLRVAEEFWAMSPAQRAEYALKSPLTAAQAEAADFETDDDPFDADSVDAPGLGILLRTDFSNEEAWQAFSEKIRAAEQDFTSDAARMAVESSPAEGVPTDMDVDADGDGDAAEDSSSDEGETSPPPIIHVLNPTSPAHQALLTGISNLTALRLLNDVSIRRAPPPPQGTARIKPPNRLVEHDGWQEVYVGKQVWVYDARSNTDQCARLVSSQGAMYGTATADSWRARASHVCELQVNLASGAMTIDFGGMDRWDYPERVRNMQEASTPIS